MKVYFGNLSYSTSTEDLNNILNEIGGVVGVKLITDRDTGRSKGFAFVEFESSKQGSSAIEAFNSKELNGRPMAVSQAKEKERPQSNQRSQRW